MKTLVFYSFLMCFVSLSATAQTAKTPGFASYAVRVESLKAKPVDLKSHKNARSYRTNLREAAQQGVNFGGHFNLVTWGCGTNCNEGAIIDERNGRVFFPSQLGGIGVGLASWSQDLETLEFKPDSNLLIINGLPGGSNLDYKNPKQGIHYLLWNGTNFREIKFVRKPND